MEFINKILENLLYGIIVAVVLAVGVAMWSLISKLSPPIIFIAGITTFAVVLTVLNQMNIWQEKNRGRISRLSDQEIEDTILKWITIPKFSVTRGATNQPNFLFSFLVTDPQGGAVEVNRTLTEKYQLTLGITIKLPEDTDVKLTALGDTVGSELVRNIRIEMIRLGIGFENVGFPLKQFVLSEVISLDDSLNKVYLTQKMLFVRQAQYLIRELIDQRLDKSGH